MDKLEIRENPDGSFSLPKPKTQVEVIIDLQERVEALEAAHNDPEALPKVEPVLSTTEPQIMEESDPGTWPDGTGSMIDNMGEQLMAYTVHIFNQNFKNLADARRFSEEVRKLIINNHD